MTSFLARLLRFLRWPALVALLLYIAVAGWVTVNQRSLIYFPNQAAPGMAAGFRRVDLAAEAGSLAAFYRPAQAGHSTLVFFNGNAGTLDGAVGFTASLRTMGYGLLLTSYPGYDGNPGRPSEAALYGAGDAAMTWLAGNGVAAPVIEGYSLGTGVAVEMATRHKGTALVLLSPFASLTRIAQIDEPWLPAALLLRDRYDSEAKIGRIHLPLLIIHGDIDTTVPLAEGRRLFEKANQPKSFIVDSGAGHVLDGDTLAPAIDRFLKTMGADRAGAP